MNAKKPRHPEAARLLQPGERAAMSGQIRLDRLAVMLAAGFLVWAGIVALMLWIF